MDVACGSCGLWTAESDSTDCKKVFWKKYFDVEIILQQWEHKGSPWAVVECSSTCRECSVVHRGSVQSMWCNRSVGYSWCTFVGPSASCGEVNIQRTEVKPRLLKAMKCPLQPQYVLFILYFGSVMGFFRLLSPLNSTVNPFPVWVHLSFIQHLTNTQVTHIQRCAVEFVFCVEIHMQKDTFALPYSCTGNTLLLGLWS